jgi:hypothetical protein
MRAAASCQTASLTKSSGVNPFSYIKNQITSWREAMISWKAVPPGDGELILTVQYAGK